MSKYEELQFAYKSNEEALSGLEEKLQNMPITSFTLNPEIAELTKQISKCREKKIAIENELKKYESEDK